MVRVVCHLKLGAVPRAKIRIYGREFSQVFVLFQTDTGFI